MCVFCFSNVLCLRHSVLHALITLVECVLSLRHKPITLYESGPACDRIRASVSMRVFRLDELSTAFCHTCVRSVWPIEVSTVVGFTGVCERVLVCAHLRVFDLREMSIVGMTESKLL